MQETDLNYLRENRLAHTTGYKVQTQEVMNCGDNSKASKGIASTLAQDFEPSNKCKKDKKKKQHRNRRDFRESKDFTTPATRVNAEVDGSGKRRRNKKDLSEVMYYNFNKKGHYSDKCLEPRRPKN